MYEKRLLKLEEIFNKLGYEVRQEPLLYRYEFMVIMRLENGIGFMVIIDEDELFGVMFSETEIVLHVVSKFNDMIKGKLVLEE